jgi:hypothetical protein
VINTIREESILIQAQPKTMTYREPTIDEDTKERGDRRF